MDRPHTHCRDCGVQLPDGDFPRTCEELRELTFPLHTDVLERWTGGAA